ncbi:MAG: hypothetical protein JW874_12025 [Spirochaetales bacterium]|nr:hypothetical protein [Spirochaetales bacterium]
MSVDNEYIEYDDPQSYFPYISHTLDQGKDSLNLKRDLIGKLFEKTERSGDFHSFSGTSNLFSQVLVNYSNEHLEITKDPGAVQIIVARHKSLFDYIIHQPTHHDLINNRIIIVAGHNLFVHKFNDSLRYFGGFMFLRDDAVLKHKNLPNAFLTKSNYLKHVFPEYLKDQVFCKSDKRHDMLVYLEYEKDRETGKSNSGRTKTGRLRELNWSFLKLLYELSQEQGIRLYLTPVNVSFSKIPDAPYVVHPTKMTGSFKNIRYLAEQGFVFQRYAKYCQKEKKAKLEIVVNYGKPDCFSDAKLGSFRDFRKFTEDFRKKIGELEVIYPLGFLFKALGDENELNRNRLHNNMDRVYEQMQKRNMILTLLCDRNGNLKNKEEIIESALEILNCNPNMFIMNYDPHHIVTYRNGDLHCHDNALKLWYNNVINHLFEDE